MQVKTITEKRVAALRAAMMFKQAERMLNRGFASSELETYRKMYRAACNTRYRAERLLAEMFSITRIRAADFLGSHTIQEVQHGCLP